MINQCIYHQHPHHIPFFCPLLPFRQKGIPGDSHAMVVFRPRGEVPSEAEFAAGGLRSPRGVDDGGPSAAWSNDGDVHPPVTIFNGIVYPLVI